MFTDKGLICNFKLICKDKGGDFSPIEDEKMGTGTEIFFRVGKQGRGTTG